MEQQAEARGNGKSKPRKMAEKSIGDQLLNNLYLLIDSKLREKEGESSGEQKRSGSNKKGGGYGARKR